MSRLILLAPAALLLSAPTPAAAQDEANLQGTWEITALIDDGALVPDAVVRGRFALDGRFAVAGQTISFTAPESLQKRTILFVADPRATPKTIDLAGSAKTGGKGIYMLAGDVLLICIGEPDAPQRPTDFSASAGSRALFITLKRVKDSELKPAAAAPAPAQRSDDELRKALVGMWGHQDDDWLFLITLNADGTFSTSRTYRKRFGKVFNEDVRTSGTWKVEGGVVMRTVTASTDKELLRQVYSFRVRSLEGRELIGVDQFGRVHREWRSQ
jgi:uncharacterized protein (TIGR03067 family)